MSSIPPVTLLQKLIAEAELAFGPKEHSYWTGVGLRSEFTNPMTSYFTQSSLWMIFVIVGQDVLRDPELLAYQLAHEAVHCLAEKPCTTALEEGAATYFGLTNSMITRERSMREEEALDPLRAAYLKDLRKLLIIDSKAVSKLRVRLKFSEIRPSHLIDLGADEDLAERLCRST